ncbi:GGDEF domain-containing protein [Ahrensia sp. 13_GOM-1096m]|uniref:GGDEF domain-containing protein n=1 Tax=Ahrensia sp. 13_GOM-1096m TaxID=1380380 RepID=UPI000684538A|nr:GGDEF domain-containing protein [Ahrensia sp. 13_GOM-1096m]
MMFSLTKQMLLVMGWAVVGAQVVTYAIVQALMPHMLEPAIMLAPIISTIVAIPLGFVFFKQNERLNKTNLQLLSTNENLERETAIARYEASIDPMTRVFNRVHFVRNVESCRQEEVQEGYFLMLDADNFKKINDTYGHDVGDAALMTITNVIRDTIREDDFVGRLGGEEFGIYLRLLNKRQAYEIAERIREKVAKSPIDVGADKPFNFTVSIGAVFAAKEQNVSEIMKHADKNLYHAKHRGRNRVVFDAITRSGKRAVELMALRA